MGKLENDKKNKIKRGVLAGATVAAVLAVSSIGAASAVEGGNFGIKAQNQQDESVSAIRGLTAISDEGPGTAPTTPPVTEPTTPPVTTPAGPDYSAIFKDLAIKSYSAGNVVTLNSDPAALYPGEGTITWSVQVSKRADFSSWSQYVGSGTQVTLPSASGYMRVLVFHNGKQVYTTTAVPVAQFG